MFTESAMHAARRVERSRVIQTKTHYSLHIYWYNNQGIIAYINYHQSIFVHLRADSTLHSHSEALFNHTLAHLSITMNDKRM